MNSHRFLTYRVMLATPNFPSNFEVKRNLKDTLRKSIERKKFPVNAEKNCSKMRKRTRWFLLFWWRLTAYSALGHLTRAFGCGCCYAPWEPPSQESNVMLCVEMSALAEWAAHLVFWVSCTGDIVLKLCRLHYLTAPHQVLFKMWTLAFKAIYGWNRAHCWLRLWAFRQGCKFSMQL